MELVVILDLQVLLWTALVVLDLHRWDEAFFPSMVGEPHNCRPVHRWYNSEFIRGASRWIRADSPSPVSTVFLLLFVKFRLPASDAQLNTVNKSSNLYFQIVRWSNDNVK